MFFDRVSLDPFSRSSQHCKTPVARAGGSNFIHTQLSLPRARPAPIPALLLHPQLEDGIPGCLRHSQLQSEERWRGAECGGDLREGVSVAHWGKIILPPVSSSLAG